MAETKLPPPIDPLRTLQAMFDGAVIQTGKWFQIAAVNKGDVQQAAGNLKLFIPEAEKRFHEALDELEMELLKAKAVFEQDLLDLRAKNAPPKPTPVIEEDKIVAELMNENTEERIADQGKTEVGEPPEQLDQTMEDQNPTADHSSNKDPAKADHENAVTIESLTIVKDNESSPAADKSHSPAPANPYEPESTTLDIQPVPVASTDQPQEEVPMSAVSQDLNFDSMFDAPTGGTTDLNAADLDFLNDFKVDAVPEGSADNTDLNSLLPGLESYANATGDDFTMVFPQTGGANPELSDATNKPRQDSLFEGLDLSNTSAPAQESNFDDLFLDGGDLGNDDDFLNDAALGEIGDFDDSLFDTKDFDLS